MSDWELFRDRLLDESPETREEFENVAPAYRMASAVIRLRRERGLTQEELARRVGTHQPAIARLESARFMPSLRLLAKVARALDAELVLDLRPREAAEVETPLPEAIVR